MEIAPASQCRIAGVAGSRDHESIITLKNPMWIQICTKPADELIIPWLTLALAWQVCQRDVYIPRINRCFHCEVHGFDVLIISDMINDGDLVIPKMVLMRHLLQDKLPEDLAVHLISWWIILIVPQLTRYRTEPAAVEQYLETLWAKNEAAT